MTGSAFPAPPNSISSPADTNSSLLPARTLPPLDSTRVAPDVTSIVSKDDFAPSATTRPSTVEGETLTPLGALITIQPESSCPPTAPSEKVKITSESGPRVTLPSLLRLTVTLPPRFVLMRLPLNTVNPELAGEPFSV